jgi:Zn-dependent metalloprotease
VVDAAHGAARLAWEVVVEGMEPDGQSPSKPHVLVDAKAGTVIGSWDEIEHANGTGDTVYSGTVPIDTTPVGAQYELRDPVRGNGYTCDMNNGTTTCSTMTDADNVWGNHLAGNRQSAAADAHYGAARTYDYYKATFGRNGIFGDGRGVPSRVHYGNNYSNAFWDGTRMTYGDGASNLRPLTSLDVAGHEMTHGVTHEIVSGGLDYSGESGGLNEATSDIFGSMVEFHANNPADPGDNLVGEKININGNGTPLRYMYNPGLDGRSHTCWSSSTKDVDVHYSSGVANHLFFLVAEGSGATPYGNSPTCNNTGITGIGRDKAQRIWYRAVEAYFTHTTKYVDAATPSNNARRYTLLAARDLYGACSIEYRTVERAWSAVNVYAAADPVTCGNDWYTWDYNPGYPIPDPGTTLRPIDVDRNGNAPADLKVAVNIKHPFRGQLSLHLAAPDGTTYLLKSASATDSADDVLAVYTVNVSAEAARGTWKLRIHDAVAGDAGTVDGWSLLF